MNRLISKSVCVLRNTSYQLFFHRSAEKYSHFVFGYTTLLYIVGFFDPLAVFFDPLADV